MACAKIGCGGSYVNRRGGLDLSTVSDQNARLRTSLFTAVNLRDCNRFSGLRVSASMAEIAKVGQVRRRDEKGDRTKGENEAVAGEAARERLDGWMRDSVVEIVKNLREAPLLIHVYAAGNGKVTTVTKKAEEWPVVKMRWERGEAEPPEGMIFVEQLEDGHLMDGCDCGGACGGDGGSGITRAWGLVVQGRGVDSGPVCYLLKTSRVEAGSGLEMWCTHFCLVRVKSFGETTASQLQNCWLLQGGT